MRKAFSSQQRLDCQGVLEVQLNLNCRDEIIPILRTLQHVYSRPELRNEILDLIARDVNQEARDDVGREGMDYWQILVLAAVRLGCDLDLDKLQDLAEQHRTLRCIMGVGEWEEENFSWRRIHDNLCRLKPTTLEQISHLIVAEGHRLQPEAAKQCRADSFVVETNIHWPTESTLIRDGIRKIIQLCLSLAGVLNLGGWRQAAHLLQKVKRHSRNIERISSNKGPNYLARLKREYRKLLKVSGKITHRARQLLQQVEARPELATSGSVARLRVFLEQTEQVRDTARRRMIEGEQVPNAEKLFSIFEPHTQLYKRGKAGEPVQFGRLVLIYEDAAGFITHTYVMSRQERDQDVVVPQTRIVQERLQGAIEEASFDRGFHTPDNQRELAEIVARPCLLKPGAKQSAAQAQQASVSFRRARQRHAGVESAIGALQAGNGLERSRDRTELGFKRYVALGVLGRNLHTLGKLLIAQEASKSEAAHSKRARVPA